MRWQNHKAGTTLRQLMQQQFCLCRPPNDRKKMNFQVVAWAKLPRTECASNCLTFLGVFQVLIQSLSGEGAAFVVSPTKRNSLVFCCQIEYCIEICNINR